MQQTGSKYRGAEADNVKNIDSIRYRCSFYPSVSFYDLFTFFILLFLESIIKRQQPFQVGPLLRGCRFRRGEGRCDQFIRAEYEPRHRVQRHDVLDAAGQTRP